MFKDIFEVHGQWMPIMWGIIVNFLIVSATFSSSKFAIILHGLGFITMTIFTIMIAYPILPQVFDDLDPVNSKKFYIHVFLGCFLMCALIYQLILGIITRILNISGGQSIFIINSKRLHMVTGIILTIIMKFQVYYKFQPEERPTYLIIDLCFLAIYLYRKIGVSKLSRDSKSSKQPQIPNIESLSSLKNEERKLIIFGNHIFDVSSIIDWHPAGFQIIESVKNTKIEKYLFGIYAPTKVPSIMPHAHSKESLWMLDSPVAKLNITSNFRGLNAENNMNVLQMRAISEQSQIYELHLHPQKNDLEFLAYTNIKQLGRFHCLTLNGGLTRLYTNVNFLNWRNALFLKQYLKSNPSLDRYFQERNCHRESVPILFKHYPDGQFTNQLVQKKQAKLSLSEQQGLSLQLNQIPSGEILILTGGTGIYPFLDLLDLLYKHHLINEKPSYRKAVSEENPLISSQIFTKFTFRVYAAFQNIREIHPLVLQEWIELSTSKIVKIHVKIKNQFDHKQYPQLNFTQENFENVAQKSLLDKKLSKIFVCGPLKMNQALTQIFLRNNVEQGKYSIY